MRVLLDTNILVSAAMFPRGVAAHSFELAVSGGFQVVVPRYALSEMLGVCERKFPSRMDYVRRFVYTFAATVEISDAEPTSTGDEASIRDPKDWPIWQAAKATDVDVLLTGDKDFLESGLTDPRILSPAQFLVAYGE